MSWNYLWRISALHRSETAGDSSDLPPVVPAEFIDGRSKRLEDGVGPMLHRRFSVLIEGSEVGPRELMRSVMADLNQAAPHGAAVFDKTAGHRGTVRPGDEYRVRMPGPWDGPVRVLHRGEASFRFGTLQGHLEAGQIEFRAREEGGLLSFEVEAWCRAGDRLADLLYCRLRVSKEIQFNMWVHFCLRAADIAGGRPRGGITIDTRIVQAAACREVPVG
ncbi:MULTISPECIES: DUF1990 family protein [unclassified Streptomyces]|uniref:DUF1990 family protein n=1 Tax=unclassified Streptomyces TaxID=2593676 RepID=UPI002E14CE22|nr:DUF1990 domain-containing protein [Streptomyces sp. NBC_01197]WSS49485.1 DUF1990 domain-containing protein [Streptomyces sp. NBC_01180]